MTRNTVDVGIDLGTTNSCAAVMVDGEAEVVRNIEWETDLTPSYVAANSRGELEVGSGALKFSGKVTALTSPRGSSGS